MIYLLVKTHNKTRLKYLCQCTTENDEKRYTYSGSGTYWKRHLKTHGKNISTQILFKTKNKEILKQIGLFWSIVWNITKSNGWANLTEEVGDGGHAFLNHRRTKESKEKQSKTMLEKYANGYKNPWLGKSPSLQTREEMSKAKKDKYVGSNNPMYKKKHSLQTRKLMSQNNAGENNPAWKGGISYKYKQKMRRRQN